MVLTMAQQRPVPMQIRRILNADCLDGGHVDTPVGRDHLVEILDCLHSWIFARRINDFAVTNDVVGDNEGPAMRMLDGLLEVLGQILLVGIDEDQVIAIIRRQLSECLESRAKPKIHQVAQAGSCNIRQCDLRVTRFDF